MPDQMSYVNILSTLGRMIICADARRSAPHLGLATVQGEPEDV